MTIKVMTVFGTRPEAVKMAPLVLELSRRDNIETVCCVTAQHRQMLDSVLEIFGIKPDYDLDIMEPGQSLSTITSKALLGIEGVLEQEKPDMVLVHGDTSTTFSGALAAFYQKIPVGHVEAGLRSFDRYSPYPEEMNRCLTSRLSELHFAPTEQNAENLKAEGYTEGVFITGNTAIDAMKTTVSDAFQFSTPRLNEIDYENKKIIVLTCHRRENYGQPMENIMKAVKNIAQTHRDVEIVYPVHLSPVVQSAANEFLGRVENVHLIDPLSVEEMHNLMARCYMVLTDSGGLQEEAPSLGKPVLVLRRETERPEAIRTGTVKLAGVEQETIIRMAGELIADQQKYEHMAKAVNPYGDGSASRRIADAILWRYGLIQSEPEAFRPR